MNQKIRTARLSILSNTLLIAMKVTVGLFSGSVSVLSEAIHSAMDLVASVVAWLSVRISDTPADAQHPYGHGKFENISGVIEALLIFVAAFWIIFEAVKKIIHPAPVEFIGYGFLVMMISAGVNLLVSRRLYRVAKETDSVALEADALHLKTDVYTSVGVATGLLLMYFSGIHLFDPIVAILVAVMILRESYELFSRAYEPLLDKSLPAQEVERIAAIIRLHCAHGISFHGLRTRKAGNYKYVDFHLNLDPEMRVREAHEICDRIEEDIRREFATTEVTIHVEDF